MFYGDSLMSYGRALSCFKTAIDYAKKQSDSIRTARAFLNLGNNYFYEARLDDDLYCQLQAMSFLKISRGTDVLLNPSLEELVPIGNKELVQNLFNSRVELLLGLYKQRNDKRYLSACLKTALLTDSFMRVINEGNSGGAVRRRQSSPPPFIPEVSSIANLMKYRDFTTRAGTRELES